MALDGLRSLSAVQAVKLKNTVNTVSYKKMYALHHIYQSHQVGWSRVFTGLILATGLMFDTPAVSLFLWLCPSLFAIRLASH